MNVKPLPTRKEEKKKKKEKTQATCFTIKSSPKKGKPSMLILKATS